MDFDANQFSNFTYDVNGEDIFDAYSTNNPETETEILDKFLSSESDFKIIRFSLEALKYYKNVYCKFTNVSFDKKEYEHLKNILLNNMDGIFSSFLLSKNVYTADKQITIEIDRLLNTPNNDPSDIIGHAKDLLEAVYKYVLSKLHIAYSNKWNMNQLNKHVCKGLGLLPKDQNKKNIYRWRSC